MTAPYQEITLGEIGRRLEDLTSEVRSLRSELVRRDVYDAQRTSDEHRLGQVEKSVEAIEEDRKSTRRLAIAAALSSGGVLAVNVATHWFH